MALAKLLKKRKKERREEARGRKEEIKKEKKVNFQWRNRKHCNLLCLILVTHKWDQSNPCKLSSKVYLSLKKERTLLLTFDTMAVNCILKYLNYPRCLGLAWQASCHWHASALLVTKSDLQFNYWIFQWDPLSCVINSEVKFKQILYI